MSKHWLHETAFYFFCSVLVVSLGVAAVLLGREVSLRPRGTRGVLIALSCFVFVLALVQITTGYYFAFDSGEVAAHIAAVMAYVAVMVLTLSSKRKGGRLKQIVGVFGLAVPVLIAVASPEILFVGIIAIFGFFNHHPTFQGRISPNLGYQVTIDRTLIGGGTYYRYSLFQNPQRLPLVRKQITDGAIYSCEVPALDVCLKSETRSGFVHIACQQTWNTVFTGEIPLTHPTGSVFLTAGKQSMNAQH
jgi:hypothetical protein